ncbi:hypothetical protein C8R43DRAFT_910064 [Mycena crocata]|nr:hypothetical protein C8R43DRAFT_910064 [Mycena crocata]
MATTASSSINNGPPQVRLLFDPNNNICPDFTSDAYAELRTSINADDDAAAVTKLADGWKKDNEKQKELWNVQVQADEAVERAAESQRQQEAAEAAKLIEQERLEEEKKKPKLGAFDGNSLPPAVLESRISFFAQKKMKDKQYCYLYPFTSRGLAETANKTVSSSDTDPTSLTLTAGPGTSHKGMVADQDLPWREFSLGNARYIVEATKAGWEPNHVKALQQFFWGIETHSKRTHVMGEKILLIYADLVRAEWFRTLGTPESFNIALINEDTLRTVSEEFWGKRAPNSTNTTFGNTTP